MATIISHLSGRQITNNSGVPQAGAKIYHYRAGTTTALTVWQNAAATVAHAQPVVCDAGGFVPMIYVDGTYDWKVAVTTSADVSLAQYSADNLPKAATVSASDISGAAALHQLSVIDKDLTAPPGGPTNGDRYIVASGATGAWASQDGTVAEYVAATTSWTFSTPAEGWMAWVRDEDQIYRHTGSAWVAGFTASNISDRVSLHAVSIEDKDLTAPPGSPVDGARYIVGASATGAWASQDGKIAEYVSATSSWAFSTPAEGWMAWAKDEDLLYRHTGSAWVVDEVTHIDLGLLTANGGAVKLRALSQTTTLSGATTDATTPLPIGIVFAVSMRVTTLITASGGGASFSLGDGSTANKFGSGLGFSVGSTNRGHIGPTGYYSGTDPLRFTVNTGSFTAGVVRTTIWYMEFTPPTS